MGDQSKMAFDPRLACRIQDQLAGMEEYIPQFLRNLNNQMLKSRLNNLNPQELQNQANNLWDYGIGQISSNLVNLSGLFGHGYMVKESVTLLIDLSPEDRLFLDNEDKLELMAIESKNRCKVDLKVSSNLAQTIHSSQIAISGPPDGVLNGYLAVRQLLPITVWFDLRLNPALPSIILDPTKNGLKEIQKKYNIALCVVPIQSAVIQQPDQIHIQIYLRTKRENEMNLKNAIEDLTTFIESHNYGQIYPSLQTKIEVPFTQTSIMGRTYSILDPLALKTSTQISVHKSASGIMSNIAISGSTYSSISVARNEISDRFMVELNFDVTLDENHWRIFLEGLGRELERIGEESGTHILMKPSQTMPNKRTMMIRGLDKEVEKVFQVRNQIFKLLSRPPNNGQNFFH